MLDRLPKRFTAVITGSGGGIGQAIVSRLLSDTQVGKIIAVSRREAHYEDERVDALQADITTQEGRDLLGRRLHDSQVHLLFNAIGLLHDDTQAVSPEKRLEDLDAEKLAMLFHVNAITPALLLKSLHASLKGKHPAIVASLSARVGSISDNGFGGWYGYRASKAAHNMLLRTAAVELGRDNRQAVVLCLHPGTTDTHLSKPFQSRVPEEKLFSADFVAHRLLSVMNDRVPEESGSFWDWAGKPISW